MATLSAMPHILIINGSLGGNSGNTGELLAIAEEALSERCTVSYLELVREPSIDRIIEEVGKADGFVFGSGTYWDSWGSPMQLFFETTAHTEGGEIWFGKPVVGIVTAHAVGAKGVLTRLLGVLNVYGLRIPPLGGLAYTWSNDAALETASDHLRRELWKPTDVQVVCHNLVEMVLGTNEWRTWPTVEGEAGNKWLYAYSGRPNA